MSASRLSCLGGVLPIARSRFVVATAFFILPSFISSALADSSAPTREEIMRQHQQLMQERQFGGSTGGGGNVDALSPPLSSYNDSGNDSGGGVSSDSFSSGVSASNGKTSSGGGDLTARLLQRVNALEAQMRQMRGTLDDLTNKVQQDEANTQKQFGDLQFALQNGASSGGTIGSKAKEPAQKVAPVSSSAASKTTTSQNAADALAQSKTALKAHRYSDAESLARQALATARSESGRVEAHYFLANALAGQKQYRQSSVAYYDIYSKNPKSPYAPNALLGLASSMLGAGSKPAACEALGKFSKEYPAQAQRMAASLKSLRDRAACH